MISFNDTLHLTKLYQDNKKQEILNFVSKKISFDNVIEFLDELKKLKFNLSTSHIKLNDNKREIILYNENFITNIPKIKSSEINLNDIIVTISYPSIITECNDLYFIKKIHFNDSKTEFIFNAKTDYNFLSYDIINKCQETIQQYKSNINNIYSYYINKEVSSRFKYDIESIIYVIYLSLINNVDSLLNEQMFLMEKFNFNYTDFDKLDYNSVKQYVERGIKTINERNNK